MTLDYKTLVALAESPDYRITVIAREKPENLETGPYLVGITHA